MAAGQGGRQGGRRPAILLRIPSLAPLVCLRHRDDAPSPLLLGILVTETRKRMKRRRRRRSQSRRAKGGMMGSKRAAETDVADWSGVVVTC